jgi:PAS domain S-box-containing protein
MLMTHIIGFLLINLFYQGIVFYPQEDVEDLRKKYAESNQKDRIEVLIKISFSYTQSNLDSAVFYANLALDEARKSNVPELIVLSYQHLAEAYNYLGEHDSVEKYVDLSRIIAEEENNLLLMGIVELDHAHLDFLQRKPLISARRVFKAIEIFQRSGNTDDVMISYFALSKYFIAAKMYDEALDHIYKVRNYFEHKKDTLRIVDILIYQGHTHRLKENTDLAMRSYVKASELAKSISEGQSYANALRYIGEMHLDNGRYQIAYNYFIEARDIFLKHKTMKNASDILTKISYCENKSGNTEKAILLDKYSLEIRKKIGEKASIASSYINLAGIFYENNKLNSALKYLDSALFVALPVNDFFSLTRIYRMKYLIYDKKNIHSLALENFILYHNASEELMSFYQKQEINNIKLRYELKETKHDLIESDLQRKTNLIYFLIVSIALLLLLAIVLYFRYRSNKLLNIKLLRKSTQLEKAMQNLEISRKELEKINNELEERVKKRTIELENEVANSKRISSELQKNSFLMKKITELIPMSLFIYDINEKKFVWANYNVVNYLGYTPDALTNFDTNKITSIIHYEDLEKIKISKINKDLADHDFSEDELRIIKADGNLIWVLVRVIIFKLDEKGKPEQLLGVAIDITDRKRKDGVLNKSIKGLKGLIDLSDSIMWTCN